MTQASSFSLKDQHDVTISLKDFAGQFVVLYFYPKDNTSGCTQEALDFQSLLPEFTRLNSVVLGLSKDSVKSHKNFAQNQGLTFSLLSDPEGKACEAYGCWVEKSLYGRQYMGIQRTTFLINPQGKIIHQWENVKVKGHAAQVLEKLGEAVA